MSEIKYRIINDTIFLDIGGARYYIPLKSANGIKLEQALLENNEEWIMQEFVYKVLNEL